MVTAIQLTEGGQVIAPGRAFDLPPRGVTLLLAVPPDRDIATFRLDLRAAAADSHPATGFMQTSDTGAFDASASARWVGAQFEGEVALTALQVQVQMPPEEAYPKPDAARVKLFRGGSWTPLPPIDVVALNRQQAFAATAASAVIIEVMQRLAADDKVSVPAAAVVTSVALSCTSQPCGLSVAVGSDPACFTHAAPFPLVAREIDGLAAAVARFRGRTPDAAVIPLHIAASGPGRIVVDLFEATLADSPAAPSSQASEDATIGAAPQAPTEDAVAPVAQLCDDGHAVAQMLQLAQPQRVTALRVHLRRGPGAITAQWTLHPDATGLPASVPVAGAVAGLELPAGGPVERQWVAFVFPKPVELPAGGYWLLCRASRGEMALSRRPDAAAPGLLTATHGGAWRAAPGGGGGLLARLN